MGQIGSKCLMLNSRYFNRNDQSHAEIFKLKMDDFEEIFDWLSLKDLVALSQTCKRMQHIVGYWMKTNYAAVKFGSGKDGIVGPNP